MISALWEGFWTTLCFSYSQPKGVRPFAYSRYNEAIDQGVDMRIEVLEYFLEIADCKSFSRASENLFISQQGLSKSMRALEGELGVTLFQKSGRGIELTEEGSILKSYALEITQRSDNLRDHLFRLQLSSAESTDTVPVYATSYVCNAIYNLLDCELGEYGLDCCTISECELNEIISAIGEGETSFGLVNILEEDVKLLEEFPYLKFTPLLSMKIIVKASKNLAPDCSNGEITLEQLSELPLAYFNEPVLNKFVKRSFENAQLEVPTIVLHSTNIGRINTLVKNSKAVTFSDTFTHSVRGVEDEVVYFDLRPSRWFSVGVLESPSLRNNAHQQAYVQRLRALIRFKHRKYISKYAM